MLKSALYSVAFTVLLCLPAMAPIRDNYMGIGIRNVSSENSDAVFNDGDDLDVNGIQFTYGRKINPFWAWELNFIRDSYDPFEFTFDDIEVEVDTEAEQFGLSFVFSPRIDGDAIPYIRFGYAKRDINADIVSRPDPIIIETEADDEGTWLGVGLRMKSSLGFDVNIEITRFTEDTTSIYIGPQFHF